MKKILRLVTRFLTPQMIATEIRNKLANIEKKPHNSKFLNKLLSVEVKNTIDDIVDIYNDLYTRYHK